MHADKHYLPVSPIMMYLNRKAYDIADVFKLCMVVWRYFGEYLVLLVQQKGVVILPSFSVESIINQINIKEAIMIS